MNSSGLGEGPVTSSGEHGDKGARRPCNGCKRRLHLQIK
jgi:hypothetical protein